MIKHQAREDLDDKESPKDSVAPSDNTEKEYFVVPGAEINITNKQSTKT